MNSTYKKLLAAIIVLGFTFSANAFQITAQDQRGKRIKMSVSDNTTVQNVKEKIQNKNGIPIEQQRLLYKGKSLSDRSTMSDENIRDGDTLHLIKKLGRR